MNIFESKFKRPMWILGFALTALVVGCGGGGDDSAAPPSGTTPPSTTGPAKLQSLGTAMSFGAGSGAGITNQGTSTQVVGDLGVSAAGTNITGFHDSTGAVYTETSDNTGTVTGTIYTDTVPDGGVRVNAVVDALTAAYNELTAFPAGSDPGAGQLGGLTLAPGVYTSASGAFLISGSDLTLDAQGNGDAFWVFQMADTLTVGDTAARSVNLINGAHAKNVYWRVGTAATINGAGGGTMSGTIIAPAGATFSTAGNAAITTLNGRAFGFSGSVTMVNTVINVPAP